MIVDGPEEFFDWLDRIERKADSGDAHARRVLARTTAALHQLRILTEPPTAEMPSLKRVRQSKAYPIWRTSHPYDPDVALRLICWFPPDSETVVVALFAGDKAPIGDTFYNSVASRADAAIRKWLYETQEDETDD